MTPPSMEGPYELTHEKIEEVITKASPGVYQLGSIFQDSFFLRYISRADSDLARSLKSWVGCERYSHFRFCCSASAQNAFEEECREYHENGGSEDLDNEDHPQRPEESDWKCPVCNRFS